MKLTAAEHRQYSRHLLMGEVGIEGQLKLKAAKVLVIGAGGLGCPVLQYLTGAGVGRIGIVDADVVSQSNLQRQLLYTQNDIGKGKAKRASDYLKLLNPFAQFDVYEKRLTVQNVLQIFEPYDLIVDGTDNFPTRYLINDAAVLLNKPVVFGSIFKFAGQVSVLNWKNGPTYRCLYPTPPALNAVPNCSEIGVLGILPGIIGSLQANEVLKMILGLGTVLSGKLLLFDALSMKQTLFSFERNNLNVMTALEEDYHSFCGIDESFEDIDFQEFKDQESSFNLLDVRSQMERMKFDIGGLHIPLDQLSERYNDIPDTKSLVVCCMSGVRSKIAIEMLLKKGFKRKLFNLKNGLTEVV